MLMEEVIIDTSAMLFAVQNKTDVFSLIEEAMPGCQILVSTGIMHELERMAASRTDNRKYAKSVLAMMEKHKIEAVNDQSYADEWIVSESGKRGCSVCTNDMALKERLKAAKIRVLSVSWNGILR